MIEFVLFKWVIFYLGAFLPQKPGSVQTWKIQKGSEELVFIWCLLFNFFKLRESGDIFIRFCAK